jgi:hypothetical protein
MVESSSNKKRIHFSKLNSSELVSKLQPMVSKRGRVILWKSSPHFYEGNALKIKEDGKIQLVIDHFESLKKFANEKVCLNCSIEETEYFFSAKVVEHDDESKIIFLELEENCFRLEKRSRERLTAYPKYDIYLYLKYSINTPRNVISFNQKDKNENQFLDKLNSDRLSKLKSQMNELVISESEELVGFRVEDISSVGISFFATESEKEKVLNTALLEHLIINIEGQILKIEDAKVVYIINYINPDFKGILMYKVGISFKHSPALKRKVEDISGIDLSIADYQKEFEEFIKNE